MANALVHVSVILSRRGGEESQDKLWHLLEAEN
jgi:hypothetical protein